MKPHRTTCGFYAKKDKTIDIIGKPVYNDQSGEEMSIEEAKQYVMEYGHAKSK